MAASANQTLQTADARRHRSRDRALAWILGAALLFTHLDWWREQVPTLHFGWVPEELLYRLCWLAVAWIYLLFFCSRIWREDGK